MRMRDCGLWRDEGAGAQEAIAYIVQYELFEYSADLLQPAVICQRACIFAHMQKCKYLKIISPLIGGVWKINDETTVA